jgi:hypothetical protein
VNDIPPHIIDYRTLYLKWANEVAMLGDHEEAVRLLERLCQLYPSLPEAWIALAKMRHARDDTEGALETVGKALKLDCEWREGVLFACQLYRETHQLNRAREILERYLASNAPSVESEREMARILVAEGHHERAWQLQLALARQSAEPADAVELLLTSLRLGMAEESRSLFEKIMSSPSIPAALLSKLLPYCGTPDYLPFLPSLLQKAVDQKALTPDLILSLADQLKRHGYDTLRSSIIKIGTQTLTDERIRDQARSLLPSIMNGPAAHIRSGTGKRVVFVSQHPKIREAKLAAGLRRLGWEVVLLHHHAFNGDATKYFDHVQRFETPLEAVFLSASTGADLFHVFSPAVDAVALAMLEHRPGRIIVDIVDVFDGMIYDCPALMPAQRYCLQSADAIVMRDLQPVYAARRGEYNLPEHRIFFPEYCWGLPRPEVERIDDEIHAVQIGYIEMPQNGEVTELGYSDIFTKLVEGGIHVHLYKHMLNAGSPEDHFAEFLELGHRTGRMHVHETVPVHAVHDELVKYDIGMNVTAHLLSDRPVRRAKNDANIISCGSARNTDYMDALLPVMTTSNLRFQQFLLRRYSMAINCTRELLASPREALAKYRGQHVRDYLHAKMQPFTIDAQTWRLAEFYERVAAVRPARKSEGMAGGKAIECFDSIGQGA